MTEVSPILNFDEDLADFVSELRSRVFASKLDSARFFNLTRPTISRYEGGQIVAPLGYLVSLADLYINRLQEQGEAIAAPQQRLLHEINKVLRWHYREKKTFQSWDEVQQAAATYTAERRKNIPSPSATNSPLEQSAQLGQTGQKEDWGEAIDVSNFYGRQEELSKLAGWLVADHCRMVALLGLGGIGKTALSIKLIEQTKTQFDFVIWRSLRNAPLPEDVLADCLKFLAASPNFDMPDGVSQRISLLMDYLRKARCLVVLDNLEAVLQSGRHESAYREGYEGYGELISRIGGTVHQSCLLLTSREKPGELELLEGKNSPVRSFQMEGLTESASQQILEDKELFGSAEAFHALTNLYLGNPLALKLISGVILELFGGNVSEFLKEGQVIFGGISRLLDQQFERLSLLEQVLMYWLAIGREFIGLTELGVDLVPAVPKKALLDALKSLRERSLIERSEAGAAFTQQPVVMEYVTERLIEQVGNELEKGVVTFLTRYALVKAQDKDYVRNAQVRLVVKPLLARLLAGFKSETALEHHLAQLLATLRALPRTEQGYGGGNIANLLYQLKGNLRGYDFSELNIWQAYLQGVDLQDANFARADLTRSVFTETFDAVNAIAFSPDGKLLAAVSANGEIRLWQMSGYPQTGQLLLSWQGHGGSVQAVAFSPDGGTLVTGSNDQTVKLWEVQTGRCLLTLSEHREWVWSVVFSPDGKLLASGSSDRTVRIWEVSTGRCLKILQDYTNSIRAVTLSHDGRYLATGGGDLTIKIWDVSQLDSAEFGQALMTLYGHSGWIQALAFSPDSSKLASSGEDGTIRLWEMPGGEGLKVLQSQHEWVWSVAFSPDGKTIASGSDEKTVRLWDVETGLSFKTLEGHNSPVRSVAFSPDGKIIASSSGDRSVKLWEVSSGQSFKTLRGHSNPVRSVAISPDGKTVASSSGDRTLKFWGISEAMPGFGQCLKTWAGAHELIWSLAYSPDGKLLATASDEKTVRLWDVNSGQCLKTLQGHSEWVQSVAFSPDGKLLASASGDRTIKLWDVSSGRCLKTLQGHSEWVWVVAFNHDGSRLASAGNDKTVKLWQIGSPSAADFGECLKNLPQSKWVLGLAFSPDGQILASSGGEDRALKLWDVKSEDYIKTLLGHVSSVWALATSPDGQLLASGSEDGLIRLWQLGSPSVAGFGQCLKILHGHGEWIRSLAFTPDNTRLVSGSEDGTIRLWQTESPFSADFGDCLAILRSDRPYERLNISNATGLSEAQKASLKALGAVEDGGF